MSDVSPEQYGRQLSQYQSGQDYCDGARSDEHSRGGHSPLNIFKNLAQRRSQRGEGAQPKRRGPKPDSKPALTRRQELNRQAQRTHRERKELYIKALEDEVLRLKDLYGTVSQDKARLAEENEKLRAVLVAHGIPLPDNLQVRSGSGAHDDRQPSESSSWGGNLPALGSSSGFSSAGVSQPSAPSASPSAPVENQVTSGQNLQRVTHQASDGKGVDYDQAGIDFVLTLERPCMSHLPYMVERANGPGNNTCGHALMATCPPKQADEPWHASSFGQMVPGDDTGLGQKTWALDKASLATLMDLSGRINLDGEITPVMAWGMVMAHPRFLDLGIPELEALKEQLSQKVRCYGFGAVTEEFEVRDAIENALSKQPYPAVVAV